MQYVAEPSKVVYRAKDGTEEKGLRFPKVASRHLLPDPGHGEADGPVLKIL